MLTVHEGSVQALKGPVLWSVIRISLRIIHMKWKV